MEGTPTLQTLPLQYQRNVVAEYLAENISEVHELLAHLDEAEAITIKNMINGTADGEDRIDLDDAFFNAGIATFSLPIDTRIEKLFDDYCADHGEYSSDDDHGPGELIGWAE